MTNRRGPLARIRADRGWSQVQVAGAAGVTIESVVRLERLQVANMQLGTLVRVAQAVGVAADELVPGLATRPANGPARVLPGEGRDPREERADSSLRRHRPMTPNRSTG